MKTKTVNGHTLTFEQWNEVLARLEPNAAQYLRVLLKYT